MIGTIEGEDVVATQAETHAGPPTAKPPRLRGGWPILGRVIDFKRNPVDLFVHAARTCGPVCGVPLLGNEIVLLSSPEAHEAFFRAPDDQLSQKEAYQFTVPVFGKGVAYDAEPEVLMEQIGFMVPALRDAAMRTYAPKMAEETERFTDAWGDSGELDVVESFKELTTYTSTRCLFGEEFRGQIGDDFAHQYEIAERGLNQIAFFWPNAPLPSFRARDKARAEIVKIIGKIVQARRESGERREDLLQALMDAQYSDGRHVTDEEIAGLILVVAFAGHHTSSQTAAWMAVELLRNPQQLPPILDELDDVLGDDGEVNFLSMRKCERLDRALRETLRMHPPLIILMRMVQYDFEVLGYRIPAGKMLMVSPGSSGLLETIWENPTRFDPDRFAGERGKAIHPYAWIPFGAGRHKCMGFQFAMLQLKSVFATLLRKYDFELAQDFYEPDYDALIVGPKRPAMIRYRRRT